MSVATIINTNEIKMPGPGQSWVFDTKVYYDTPYKILGNVNIDLSKCTSRKTRFEISLKNGKNEYYKLIGGGSPFVSSGTADVGDKKKIIFGSNTEPVTDWTTVHISLIIDPSETVTPVFYNLSLTSQPLVSSKSGNVPVPINVVTKSGNVPSDVGKSEHNYMPNILITLFFLIILFLFFYLKKNKMSGFGYRK